jgi:hypothetical protein
MSEIRKNGSRNEAQKTGKEKAENNRLFAYYEGIRKMRKETR